MAKQCYVFEVRANLDVYNDIDDWREAWKGITKKWVVQQEAGKEDGYEHWQGRISIIKKSRKHELLDMLKGLGRPLPNYLEPTCSNEKDKEAFYCLKEDTKIGGPWKDTDEIKYIPRQFKGLLEKLYPWQEEVFVSDAKFNDRSVDCIIDKKGCAGKSTIARLCMLHKSGIMLPMHNDGVKLIQAACCQLIGKQCRKPSHIIIDLPRAYNKDKLGGLYSAIELIKVGPVYDERNQWKEWWYDSPRVWVFSNEPPDFNLLSADRWKCWTICPRESKLIPWVPAALTANAGGDD